MIASKAAATLPETYYTLVKQFPLAHVRDEAHLAVAQDMIDRLLEQDLDRGAQAYLDVLTDLVEAYEEEHYPIAHASEADVLRELMRSHGLSQQSLSKKAGIAQSTLSAVLCGNRTLTKGQVIALANLFGISPAAFLPVPGGRGQPRAADFSQQIRGSKMADTIPYTPGSLPPSGWILAQLRQEDGSLQPVWVDPKSLRTGTTPKSELSADQVARLRKVAWALREHDPRPFDTWLQDFRADADPENEVRIYEALAAAYQGEVQLRKSRSKQERHLLYTTLLAASMLKGDSDLVLVSQPQAKGLKSLERAVEAYRAALRQTS